jgi:type IV secretion system protein VirB10
MGRDSNERVDQPSAGEPTGAIRDRRIAPRGVLPRHVQMWVMVAIAIVILAIILLTGQSQPTPRSTSSLRPAEPTLVSPERVRSYEQALAAEAERQQQQLARNQAQTTASKARVGSTAGSQPVDPLTDEQRRREYQSLFADNLVLSRRPDARQPLTGVVSAPSEPGSGQASGPAADLALLQQLMQAASRTAPAPPAAGGGAAQRAVAPTAIPPATEPSSTTSPSTRSGRARETGDQAPPRAIGPIPAGAQDTRLLEGTVIETVLLNRLDGTFAGPVTCLVTTPVYSHDRQAVVIPAGARVLGASSPVQTWGDSRLAVSFHRLVMPDGRTYSLDRFKGLSQVGDTGLKDSVNRHYWQVFGASLAIGAISGLAQYGTRSGFDSYTFGDSYRQAAGSSLAASAGRVLDRYLNVLPTITIREGYRIKVYLTNDLDLPIYEPVSGGAR